MHRFHDLADRSTRFILAVLDDERAQVIEALQTSSASHLVKRLQMIELHRVVTAVGTFAVFEAMLQSQLASANGFRAAISELGDARYAELTRRFNQYVLAVNVLKHGRGPSYDRLVSAAGGLPFRVRQPEEDAFEEGDVSEIDVLIAVDDAFVRGCVEVIREVASALEEVRDEVNASAAGECMEPGNTAATDRRD